MPPLNWRKYKEPKLCKCGKPVKKRKNIFCSSFCHHKYLPPFKGKKHTIKSKEKTSKSCSGKKRTLAQRLNYSLSKIGEKNPQWKGGITPISKIIRRSLKYRLWRKYIFERDNYTCKICKNKGGKLCVDHIKPFAYYPKLRFKLSNGRTLCFGCHIKTDTYAYKINKKL